MKKLQQFIPWVLVGGLALWVVASLRPPKVTGPYHVNQFAQLPVLLNGRMQPLDTVARDCLLAIHGQRSVALAHGQRLSAIQWLMEVTMKPEVADTRPVFRIDHPDLQSLLHLQNPTNFYFSFNQLQGHLSEVDKQAARANQVPDAQRNAYERAVLKLQYGLYIYQRLENSLRPETVNDPQADLAAYQKAMPAGIQAVQLQQAGQKYDHQAFNKLLSILQPYQMAAKAAYPLIIPPPPGASNRNAWVSEGHSMLETLSTGHIQPAVKYYAAMVTAYRDNHPQAFNQALTSYRQWLHNWFQPELTKAEREVVYNTWQPFLLSTVLYLVAFLLGLFSWFGWFRVLNKSGFYILGLAFVVHTIGILFRMWLEGRPPVTNLYSSAIFVGWGAVGLGLILERFHRNSIGLVMAAMVGFITQIIAHNLALGGDTMEALRAVLNTNFWLATHVTTITMGYAATFVAGALAILYVLRGLLTRSLDRATRTSMTRMVYGIVCFATLFSFVGTILGGIWADQSWGRFWGWDPKENGALIIVLWNALILHARWGGFVKERGLMNLAIFGNIVTSFSWFGVNLLGVGLHSYGFTQSGFNWLLIFIASQLAMIGLGLLPTRYWASFRAAEATSKHRPGPGGPTRGAPSPRPA